MADSGVEVRGVEQLQRALAAYPRIISRAAQNAVNRTATGVRREVVNGIAEETTARKAPLNRRVKLTKRAKPGDATAIVGISRSPVLIRDFGTKTKRRASTVAADISTRPGVGVEVVRKAFRPIGKPKKEIYERAVQGGQRVSRYPIKLASGPSAAVMVQPLMPEIIRKGEVFLAEEFEKDLQKGLRRVNARQ